MRIVSIYISLLVLLAVGTSCSKFHRILKSDDIEKKTESAFEYYEKDKDYFKSGVLFEELIPVLKGGKQAEKAQFYFAYCYFKQREYDLSAYYFQKFNETYPLSEFAEEAYYMYVYSLYKISPRYNLDQSNTLAALEAIGTFMRKYPKSKFVEDCNLIHDALNLKLEKKAYEITKQYFRLDYNSAAVTAIDNFLEEFPNSEFGEELSYYKVLSQYRLSKISVDEKKKDRLYETISYYESFIDKYPGSKYQKDAEQIYGATVKVLEKINKNKS